MGEGTAEIKGAGRIIRPERVELTEEHVVAGFNRVGSLQPRKVRLNLGGSLGIHVVRSAIGTDRCEVADIDSRENRIGECGLQILRQSEGSDIESDAERCQFDNGARIPEPELAEQIRRKGLGVAEGRGVREGFLVSAAVSPFARERDIGVRARTRGGLMAISEEHPILRSEVLVRAGEPLVGMRDLGEIRCPVGLECRSKGKIRIGVVAHDLPRERINPACRNLVIRKDRAGETATTCPRNRGRRIKDPDQRGVTAGSERLREVAGPLQEGWHCRRWLVDAMIVYLLPVE